MKKFILLSFCFIVFIAVTGCGVSKRAIENAEKRIQKLSDKGVPDSLLSRAKVFVYQARDSKERGNFGLARRAKDSMRILIARAEDQFEKDLARLNPWVKSKRGVIAAEIGSLTGLNRKHADSLIGIIDSFSNLGWVLQTEFHIKNFFKFLPQLKFDEKRGEELRPRIPGVWKCTQVTKHRNDRSVHAVEDKIFTFKKDGKVELVEKKRGKSTPFFKEDWKFISWGKWDVKGDTIHLFIERFRAAKQNFWDLKEKDGRKKWIGKSDPSYDSTITDGSQDRFVTFEDLKKDFTR